MVPPSANGMPLPDEEGEPLIEQGKPVFRTRLMPFRVECHDHYRAGRYPLLATEGMTTALKASLLQEWNVHSTLLYRHNVGEQIH